MTNSGILFLIFVIMLYIRDLASIQIDLADILPGVNFSRLKNSKILKTN